MAMNPDVKDKWITRLMSRQDEQGRSYLNRDNKLCCLGVLCEIAVEEGVIAKRETDDPYEDNGVKVTFYGASDDSPGDCALLPPAVREWAGLDENNPKFFEPYTRASDLNDEYEMTFRQIALIINDKL